MVFLPAAVSPATSPRKTAILVVEDGGFVRAMLVDAMRARERAVLAAANNVRGFDSVDGDAIDVMLTDRPMPCATGAVALAAARCQNPDLKGLIAPAELSDPGRRAGLDC